MFYCAIHCVPSSFAVISLEKRELVALLTQCGCYFSCAFLTMLLVGLYCVIVVLLSILTILVSSRRLLNADRRWVVSGENTIRILNYACCVWVKILQILLFFACLPVLF